MSQTKSLFVLVEGRVVDKPFYHRLLSANPKAVSAGFDIRLVESMKKPKAEGGGSVGGGKPAALKIYARYKADARLVQRNSRGSRRIVFMLDRDLDFLLRIEERSKHVIYTTARDVEAEIHLNGDLAKALSTSLSLTTPEAASLTAALGDHARALADRWQEWITLGVLAMGLKANCSVRPGNISSVHAGAYGAVDETKLAAAEAEIVLTANVAGVTVRRRNLESKVAAYFARGEQRLLVKGKWLPGFMHHEIRKLFDPDTAVDFKGIAVVGKCLLDTLDYTQPWAKPYHVAINRVA